MQLRARQEQQPLSARVDVRYCNASLRSQHSSGVQIDAVERF